MTSQRIAGPITGPTSMFIAQSFLARGTASTSLLDGSESDGTDKIVTGGAGMTSGWTTISATLTNAATVAPDGSGTASSLLETTADNRHGVYIVTSGISVGASITLSVYAKMITTRYLQLCPASFDTSAKVYAYYDLQDGVVTDSGILAASGATALTSTACAAAVNGFYKCTATFVIDSTATSIYTQMFTSGVATYGAPLSSDSPRYVGNTSNGAYLWRPKVV